MSCHVRRSVIVLLAVAAAGCAGAKLARPVPLTIQLEATPEINADEQGRALPTVVRLYLLRSSARLERADYDVLYGDPRGAIGEDVVAMDELVLSPGQIVRRTLECDPAARALAVVAVVRRPAGLTWRAVAQLAPPSKRRSKDQLAFSLEAYRVQQR